MSSTPTEETAAVVPKENGKSKKGKPVDASRFEGQGQNFKAKLIGIEDVPEPRGEKMCQVAMAKLKAAVTAMGDHKTKIVVNVSLEGLKIYDEKFETVLHAHQVNRVSFIARDNGDSRAFGYIFNREDGVHQYFGIKTEKAAEALVLCMRDLFQTCFELKKEQQQTPEGDAKSDTASSNTSTDGAGAADAKNKETQPTETSNDNLLNWDGDNKSSSAFPDKIETATSASSDLWFDGGLTNGLSNLQIGAYPNLPQMTSPTAPHLQMTSPLVTQQFQMTSPGATQQNLMTSPVIAQQQFIPQAMLSQNSQFAAFPPPVQPANPGMQMFPPAPWQSSPSMQLGVPPVAARPPQLAGAAPQNQSWTMFDSSSHATDVFKSDPFFSSTPTMAASAVASQRPSSIDISSVHASATDSSSMLATKSELLSNATVSPQFDNAFSMTPLQPQSILPHNASIPSDPFAELTSLNQPSWKKVTKEDFIKEPPKPTLLDLAASTDQSKGVSNASDVQIFGPSGPFCHIPAPNTQMTTSGSLDKLHTFDFSAQKFSVLNDKRSLANAPIVQWPSSQTPPPIPTRAFDDRSNHGTAVERPRPRSTACNKIISPLNAKVKSVTNCMKNDVAKLLEGRDMPLDDVNRFADCSPSVHNSQPTDASNSYTVGGHLNRAVNRKLGNAARWVSTMWKKGTRHSYDKCRNSTDGTELPDERICEKDSNPVADVYEKNDRTLNGVTNIRTERVTKNVTDRETDRVTDRVTERVTNKVTVETYSSDLCLLNSNNYSRLKYVETLTTKDAQIIAGNTPNGGTIARCRPKSKLIVRPCTLPLMSSVSELNFNRFNGNKSAEISSRTEVDPFAGIDPFPNEIILKDPFEKQSEHTPDSGMFDLNDFDQNRPTFSIEYTN